MITDKKKNNSFLHIFVIISLLLLCALFTFYFHAMIDLGRVFSHFYYIPIILACLWWRRKGVFVAVFLSSALISSQLLIRPDYVFYHDYVRAGLFLLVSALIAILTERIWQTKTDLCQTRDYLQKLINHGNAPFIVWNRKNEVTLFNPAFELLTGYEAREVIGQRLDMLFPDSTREDALSKIKRTLSGEFLYLVDIPILRRDGEVRYLLWNSANIDDGNGEIQATVAQGVDISEIKIIEDALLKRVKELNGFFDLGALNEKKLPLGDLIDTFLKDIIPKSMMYSDKTLARLTLDDKVYGNSDFDFSGKCLFSPIIIKNKERGGLSVGYSEDLPFTEIYEQKLINGYAERLGKIIESTEVNDSLQKSRRELQRLSAYLERVREEERIRISREIHDELGQQLTVLKLELARLNGSLGGKEHQSNNLIGDMMASADTMLQTVQRIANDLRPSILDHFGLVSAIEWMVEDFQKRTGISAEFEAITHGRKLSDELSTALFRVTQEILTNIVRHANATQVSAFWEESDTELTLVVRDNGIGIAQEKIYRSDALGFIGINERLRSFNGCLEIGEVSCGGTFVRVSVPLDRKNAINEKDSGCG